MRWFGKKESGRDSSEEKARVHPLVPKEAWCFVCDRRQRFTRVWRRAARLHACPACAFAFGDPELLYQKIQPACPQCREPLEQPDFDYGLCDGCGSKFELMEGTKPGFLPNKRQRDEMDKHGKSWSWS